MGGGLGKVKAGSRPPWVGLAAAVWVQVAAGSAYVFPLYSHAVKEALGYNQKALTMLGVANDVGENVGLVPGVLANRLPPWLILLIGSACAFFGFGTVWLAVTKTVAMPYWVVRSHPTPPLFRLASLHPHIRDYPASMSCFVSIDFDGEWRDELINRTLDFDGEARNYPNQPLVFHSFAL